MKHHLIQILCFFSLTAGNSCNTKPDGLMVEFIRDTDHVYILDSQPEFSWIVPEKIKYQSAYQILVATSKEKLDDIADAGANAMCLVCPFCSVMYDDNQKSIESEFGESYKLPVLYLPQLLGLAMGFDRKELGLNLNVVKTKKLLSKYFDSN